MTEPHPVPASCDRRPITAAMALRSSATAGSVQDACCSLRCRSDERGRPVISFKQFSKLILFVEDDGNAVAILCGAPFDAGAYNLRLECVGWLHVRSNGPAQQVPAMIGITFVEIHFHVFRR